MLRISQNLIWVLLIFSMWNKTSGQPKKDFVDQKPNVA
jgi:hypothetical protein